MHSRFRDFIVGLTAIIALAGFAILLLLFGELASLWQKRYPLAVHANASAGLRVGSQVTVNGVVVGSVTAITLQLDDRESPVRIETLINESFDIPLDARPAVGISLLGGGQRLDLQVPKDGSPNTAFASRTSVSVITAHFESLSDLIESMKLAVNGASGTLSKLDGLFASAGSAFDGVGKAAEQAQRTLTKADDWLSDEQMREDLRETLFNAKQATASIARVVDGVEKDAPKLIASLTRASDQVSQSLAEIDALMRQAREGPGTAGRLMSNPDLYNNLNDAAQRLSSVLRQAQLLLEKVKQEGLDVKF